MLIQRILLLEDEETLRADLEKILRSQYELVSVPTLAKAQEKLSRVPFDLIITETTLKDGTALELLEHIHSRVPLPLVLVISASGSMGSAVECLNHGAFTCVLKPFSRQQIEAVMTKAEDHARLVKVAQLLSQGPAGAEEIGHSPAIEQLRALVRKVARTEAIVLIQGESGVGKELVARSLFAQSPRASAPFIKFDCAANSDSAAELLGAPGRAGLLELARGGTILLDEIALLPASAQLKLFRVLEKREIDREKGKPLAIDVRIIATTNRRLEENVRRGQFREDLFLALNIVPITVPPLRERPDDIPLLAEYFRERSSRRYGTETPPFPPATLNALQQHSWPGNIAELEHATERALLLAGKGEPVLPDHFGLARFEEAKAVPTSAEADSLARMEKNHIFAVLEKCDGNRTHAAVRLGISIRTLRNKLREYKASSPEPPPEE